jgi:hypothetical protein
MSGVRGQSELRLKAARLQRQKSRYKMTAEDKILIVADQLAVVSRQRIIGLEKNIADLKAKLKKKTSERTAEVEKPERRKAFKARENGTLCCPWCWTLHGSDGTLEPIRSGDILHCWTCNHNLFVG